MNYIGENSSSILDSLKTSNLDSGIESLTGESNDSFLANIPWYAWLTLVVIITFLGVNLYMYLENGSGYFENIFASISKEIKLLLGFSVDEHSNNSLNSKLSSNNTNINQNQTHQENQRHQENQTHQQNKPLNQIQDSSPDSSSKTSLFKALNSSEPEVNKNNSLLNYKEDESHSAIQQSKTSSKNGWCYIGEDRGVRSCVKVNDSDTCMSGNIFPSENLCVNPNLRV
jgi:hypothetical protein